jgi:DNA replication protein DnaC
MQELLTKLRLARIRNVHEEWVERASREAMPYRDFLRGLLEEELCAREENAVRRLIQQAKFPFEKGIDQFDFRFRPELKRQVFATYLDSSFVEQGRALVLIGAAGLGKTHLSVSIGLKMCALGYHVRFITAQALVNQVLAQPSYAARNKVLAPYLKCDLLCLDELGYLPSDPQIGPVLYEVIAGRYEKKAIVLTSNKSLTDWSGVLHDSSLAVALVDRLMHHGEVFYFQGDSYRLRGKKKLPPETKPEQEAGDDAN